MQLLERTTRKVLLSPAGERIAAPGTGGARRDRRAAGGGRGGTGPLHRGPAARRDPHRGAVPAADRAAAVPPALPRTGPPGPRGADRLAAGGAGRRAGWTCCCSRCRSECPGSTELPLFDEDFVLRRARRTTRSAAASDIPREALRELQLLLLDEGHCLRDQALDICREAGRTDRGAPVTTTAAGLSTLVQLVAGGTGRDAVAAHRASTWRPAATSTCPRGTSPTRPPRAGSPWPCARERPARASSRSSHSALRGSRCAHRARATEFVG